MKKGSLKTYLLLFLAAVVWGFGFAAQSSGMDYVGPFTFNAIRFFLGSASLAPLILIMKQNAIAEAANEEKKKLIEAEFSLKRNARAGFLCGAALAAAAIIQQFGIMHTTAGECSFTTALYMLFIPIFGFFVGKRAPRKIWVCIAAALIGLYMLCVSDGFHINPGTYLNLLCAVLFAVQMLLVDKLVNDCNPVLLSALQFLTAGVRLFIGMLIFETPTLLAVLQCAVPILYSGIISCGLGYTLQVVGQRDAEPTVASIILSLESVVGAIGGWMILGESLSGRQLFGAAIMFAATVAVTIPKGFFKKKSESISV